ncbi:MAG: hypothetical protein ACJ77N_05120 [Chloroflexota bacterium]
MVQVQEWWRNKLNPNERLVGIGALVVIVAWVVGLVIGGAFGTSTIALLGAIAALAILWLKYAPNQQITWPAPVPTLLLAIGAISAILAVIAALGWLSAFGGFSFFGGAILVAVAMAVGSIIMAWGAWVEYQVQQKTAGP